MASARQRLGGATARAPLAAREVAVEGIMNELFRKFSQHMSKAVGSPWAFVTAFAVVLAWAVSGPMFGFSDTWQLVINTGTTIVTFLMVFLIQNTQNRDAQAIHLKLDELVRAVKGARQDIFVDLEEKSDEEIERVHKEIMAECGECKTAEEHEEHLKRLQTTSAA
jgi:low affinity Fe/Cu permease